MKLICLLPICAGLISCGAQKVSTPPQYPVTFTHKIAGNQLTVNATVTNNTAQTISLVKNPNFYGISVRAQDPKKDEAIRPKIVTYGPAVSKDVAIVAPGHATTFSTTFAMRRLLGGPIEVERVEQSYGPRSFMVISDDTFKTTFSYEHYPRFLSEKAKKTGQNFLITPLRGQSTFRRPLIPVPSLNAQPPAAIKKPQSPAVPDTV